MRAEHPEAKITELTTIISDRWKTVDEDTKACLEAEYKVNKEKAAKAKAEYEEKYGKIERKTKKKRIAKGEKAEKQEEGDEEENEEGEEEAE